MTIEDAEETPAESNQTNEQGAHHAQSFIVDESSLAAALKRMPMDGFILRHLDNAFGCARLNILEALQDCRGRKRARE
jgi:hypothetical protein